MAAKPMSKTKIVAHIAEKVSTPKKTVAQFFEELHKLAVKEAKGGAGKFVIPGIGRVVKAHRKARIGRTDQDQGEDRCPPPSRQGPQGCCSEVALSPAREKAKLKTPGHLTSPSVRRGFLFCPFAYSVFT